MIHIGELTITITENDGDATAVLVRRLASIICDDAPNATASSVRDQVRLALQEMVIGDGLEFRSQLSDAGLIEPPPP